MKPFAFTFTINGRPFAMPFVRFSADADTARAEFERMAAAEWPGKTVRITSVNTTDVP